jgi:hypothetical protein
MRCPTLSEEISDPVSEGDDGSLSASFCRATNDAVAVPDGTKCR